MSDEIRIARGRPTEEELAAIVGVLLLARTPAVSAAPTGSRWAASARPGRTGRTTGWRASGLPRP